MSYTNRHSLSKCTKYIRYIIYSMVLIGSIVGLSSYRHISYANYDEFKQNLYEIGVGSDIIEQDRPLFRYDMVRLISTIKCVDCIHPPESVKKEMNQLFWSNFILKPGKNFDDIVWRTSNFNNENYFYCVSINAKNDVVNGYPRLTNVLCPGKFCGTNLLTQGELIQIIYNIAKYQTDYDYQLDRSKVKKWIDGLDKTSNEYKSFHQDDLANINDGVKRCGSDKCQITTPSQLDTFTKYCTHKPSDCGFIYFGNTTVGQWPLGELNVLMDVGVLNIVEGNKIMPNEIATTQQILSLIYRLNLQIKCKFDLDYDKDGISNQNDNCPYNYNSSQNDMDGDTIGDVCDEDIDGDGALNPIGIVDDQGITNINQVIDAKTLDEIVKTYIIDRKITTGDIELNMGYDQCPFDNSTQKIIFDKNNYGIQCNRTIQNNTALSIKTTVDVSNDHDIAVFEAVSSGVDCKGDYDRDLGDGSIGKNKIIAHRYMNKGGYTVKVEDCVGNVAITQVYFGSNDVDNFALQIIPDKLYGPVNFVSNIDNQRYGDYESIKWGYEDSMTTLKPESIFTHMYNRLGANPVVAYGRKDNKIRAISKANLYVQDSGNIISSYLKADKINPSVGDGIKLATYISGFSSGDIENIERDLDDKNIQKNTNTHIYHVYYNPGTKIITQTITLKDKRKLENIIQLYVSPIKDDIFYANLKADPMIGYIGDKFMFSIDSPYISDILTYTWTVSDGTHTMTTGPSLQKYFYRPGTQNVTVKIALTNKQTYDLGVSVEVKKDDICSDIKKLKQYKCDMDGDNIPDICDIDIDGDGYKNLLGLIISQDENCKPTLNPEVVDNNGNLSNSDPTIDNCPINYSEDQGNKDKDQYGDICDPNPDKPEPDNKGVKPYTPDRYKPDGNGGDDRPVGDLGDLNKPSSITNNCISCPCQFYNNLNPVMPGDVVQAVIKYDGGYIYSNPFLVK